MLLFSSYYGLLGASTVTFNGDAVRELSARVLALARRKELPLLFCWRIATTPARCANCARVQFSQPRPRDLFQV
jgi:hypothetical protein